MSDLETHEQRSCLRKTRYASPPDLKGDYFRVYECNYCKGFHLATNKLKRNGDVTYTKEGWPIVPDCTGAR